jgi:arylsulfatase A-like enzyme
MCEAAARPTATFLPASIRLMGRPCLANDLKVFMKNACLALLLGSFVLNAIAVTPKPPNVLFILADDLGVNDISLYGSKFHETPNIDALARQGMKFNQAYSASPLCSPTRSSILTGLFPARIGITAPDCHLTNVVLDKHLKAKAGPNQKTLTADSVTRFSTNYYTLAAAFRANGYTTAHFGKWHLGAEPFSPLQHGFDTDIPHTAAPSPLANGFFYPFHVWKNHGRPGDNLEDDLCDEAVKFIAGHKDRPFFLNYWAFEVHSPWQAKTNQVDKYRAKADPKSLQRNPVYAGMIETLDEVVGRLVAALDKAGVRDNTIIIFTSDNGPYFIPNAQYMLPEFSKVPITSAQPLRAGKGTIYEAGTRVPLIIAWPGRVKPGTETEALMQSTDFFPTFADLLGWKLPAGLQFDGVSLRPVLERNETARDEIFCHFPHGEAGGEFEQQPAPTPAAPASSVRVGDWKLIRFYCDSADRSDRYELYNLACDPGERHNLASEESGRVKQMALRLDDYLNKAGAVIPKPNPTYDPKAKPANPKPGGPKKSSPAVK